MRSLGWTYHMALMVCVSSPTWAQETNTDVTTAPSSLAQTSDRPVARPQNIISVPLIAFDRDRIFAESELGQILEARLEALRDDLVAENNTIFADLEAEEKELTALKATLSSEAFSVKADAFDAKVIAIRAEQKAKSEMVQQTHEASVRDFEQSLNAVLTEIAQEVRAVAVFERKQIYLMSGSIDISLEAIKRLNIRSAQVLADEVSDPDLGSNQ